jgi:predicted porin
MKKSLLAVAAIGAFASAAQAQSSVTVYGILDVGFTGKATRTNTSSAGGVNRTQANLLTSDTEQSSRLGFRGTEDLGGGMSAFFTVETGLTPVGTQMSTMNNRQSFVGLKKNGIGQFAIGTQYTPIHNAFAATDAGGNNNTVGNVVRPISGTEGSNTSPSTAYTISTTNTLSLQSDRFAGFQLQGQYSLNAQDATQRGNNTTVATNGGNINWSGYGIGANYTWNKLYATAVYQSFKNVTDNANPLTPVFTTISNPGTTITNTTLTNITDNQWYAGATYDFGILKAYANYVNRKATSNTNSNQYLSRTAQQIGVRSFITPKVEGWASAGTGRYQTFGSGEPTVNFNAWQLGSNYWLSKRTNLYAIYGQTLTSNATSTAAGINLSAGASQYALGVRHTF